MTASTWNFAFRNLSRNRRRNLVSILAIALGYAGLLLMGSYITRTEHYMRVNTIYINHTGHISIFHSGGLENSTVHPLTFTLSKEEQNVILSELNQMPQVEFAGLYLSGMGLVSNGCFSSAFLAKGVDLGAETRIRQHSEVLTWTPELIRTLRGRPLTEFDSFSAISVTEPLARSLNKPKVADDVGIHKNSFVSDCTDPRARDMIRNDSDVQLVARSFGGDFSAVDTDIVSHHTTGLAFAESTGLVASLALLQKLLDTDRVTYIAVYLKNATSLGAILSELRGRLRQIQVDIYPYSDEQIGLFYAGVMNFLFTMATFFYLLVIAMCAVTIANFVTMGIIERKREIGTLRAIGYPLSEIVHLFLRESLALTSCGLFAGFIISMATLLLINHAGIRFRPPGIAGDMPFLLYATPSLCFWAALLVSVISLVSSFYTLKRRTKDDIVTLLT